MILISSLDLASILVSYFKSLLVVYSFDLFFVLAKVSSTEADFMELP